MYETEPQDIESPRSKPHKSPSHPDAFVHHLADELKRLYGKKALAKAIEDLQAQQDIISGKVRGNAKHAKSMSDHLAKAIELLKGT